MTADGWATDGTARIARGGLASLSRRAACRAGTSAVEFALVAPLFLLLLFGTIAFGTMMATYSAVQQLVAESARATVGGLSDTERDQLARSFVTANVHAYPFLDPTRLSVTTAPVGGAPSTFDVTLSYDMSASFIYSLAGLVPLPSRTITRSAVVQSSS